MGKLSGKVALVTGGSKGIGVSIAKHLAEAGAEVVVTFATDLIGADKTTRDISAFGGVATSVRADFSKPEEIVRTFNDLKATHNRLDILVNNAGVYAFGPLEQVTPEEFHRQFNLNVLGVLISTREALAFLRPEGASVINIGSTVGTFPPAFSSIYSASKAAINSISISLSKELGPRRIRVNSLNPGLIETEGAHTAGVIGAEFEEMVVRTTPLGRIGQPNDIGSVAVFLASDDSRWVTGQVVNVAGGQTM
jgi:3-oxoacyl-[acyl-carrier protein] reductase